MSGRADGLVREYDASMNSEKSGCVVSVEAFRVSATFEQSTTSADVAFLYFIRSIDNGGTGGSARVIQIVR